MSAALYRNIALREHCDRTRSLKREAAAGYTEATGVSESVKYTGSWEEVLAKAADICSLPADEMEVACTCTRLGGGLGELSVQYAEFRKPEGSGGESGQAAPGTKENPFYTVSYTTKAESLMLHPRYGGLTEDDRWILRQIENGAHPDSVLEYGSVKGRLRDLIAYMSYTGNQLALKYLAGVTQYLEVYTEATARWKGEDGSYPCATICTPPGPINTPSGRNWLCAGCGMEESGGEIWQTAKFILSGAGGWDSDLYSTL